MLCGSVTYIPGLASLSSHWLPSQLGSPVELFEPIPTHHVEKRPPHDYDGDSCVILFDF